MAQTISDTLKQPDAMSPQKRQGSGFTNLQRVIGANQGNQLSSTVGGGVQQQANQARQNIQQAQGTFNDQANVQRTNLANNTQQVGNLLQDPTKASDQDAQQYQTILKGQYNGPTGLQNADQLQAQAQSAQQLGQQIGSSGGRQALLQRYAGGPQYSQGQQRLDTLLMGSGNTDALKQARRSSLGLNNEVQQGNAAAQQQAQALQNQTQQLGQTAQTGLTTGRQTLADAIAKQQTDLAAQKQAQFDAAQKDFASGNLTDEELAASGLKAGQHIYDVNLGGLIGQQSMLANQYNAATPEQAARLAALGKLSGESGTFDPMMQKQLQDYGTSQEIGKYAQAPGYEFGDYGKNALASGVSNAKQRLQDALAAERQADTVHLRGGLSGDIYDPNQALIDSLNKQYGVNRVIKRQAPSQPVKTPENNTPSLEKMPKIKSSIPELNPDGTVKKLI